MFTINKLYTKLPFHYGWIILGICFLGLFASLGVRTSFGAYVTSWESTFEVNRTFVSIVSSVSLITYGVFQPITGRLNDRFGGRIILSVSLLLIGTALIICAFVTNLWVLIFFYGIMASIGFSGASNVTATAIAARWFSKKRGLSMGIVLSGMASGQLVLVPMSIYFIAAYDWRVSMLIFGIAIAAVLAPISYVLTRSNPTDIGSQMYGALDDGTSSSVKKDTPSIEKKEVSVWVILKNKYFWLLTLPYFICGFTDLGLIGTHFIPYGEGKGFSASIIVISFSLIALFNILGTIFSGYFSDRYHRGKLLAYIYILRGLTFILLLLASTPTLLIIFAIIYGITEVASIAPTSSLSAHLFNQYSIGTIFGFISLSHQIGAAVGSILPGIFYDLFGNYVLVFILCIVLLVISGFVVSKVPDKELKENDLKATCC